MTCMIIDDEPLAVKLLESFVARTPQLELKSSYTDSVEAVAALRRITKIIDLVTELPKPLHDLGEISVAPTGRHIDTCHRNR